MTERESKNCFGARFICPPNTKEKEKSVVILLFKIENFTLLI